MITVRIPKATLHGFGADIHAALHTLETLKKAGIPVLGSLLPMGVRDGRLITIDDNDAPDVVWTWDYEEDLS